MNTGILGQLNTGAPSISNEVTPQKVPDSMLNLADLLGNNPAFANNTGPDRTPEFPAPEFPGFDGGARLPAKPGGGTFTPTPRPGPTLFDPMFGGGGFNPGIGGMLPSPQQPSSPPQAGFDTNAFSDQILTGVGDLFQEYMGPQQPETMPGALPIGSIGGGLYPNEIGTQGPGINGGIHIGLPDPNDFRIEGGPARLTPDELQQQQLDLYRGSQQIQPEFYDFNQNPNLGPTTGTANTQPGLLEDDGMNTNYNNASGIQSAFRGF